ncbi:MAG: DUF481 domain-containing protein [Bacteroidales bacterium]
MKLFKKQPAQSSFGSLHAVFFLLLVLTIAPPDGFAQLVNIEKDRKEQKEGFQGNAALSLTLTKNTTSIFQISNQINLQYHKDPHTVLFLNNIGLMQVDGDNLINNGFQHLRYNYEVTDDLLTLEAFTQHQYNTIRLLQRRFLLGAGPRLKVLEGESVAIFLAPLVMYEYEQLSNDQQTQTRKFKGDLYFSGSLQLGERLFFSHTTYYQPDFAAFSEFRLASDTSLDVKISNRFSLQVAFDYLYDSHPPQDVPNTFYTLRNGLRYSF